MDGGDVGDGGAVIHFLRFTWRNLLCFIGIHCGGIVQHNPYVHWECQNCLHKIR